MRGVKVTCPECTMDIRFINTWHDPVKGEDGAASLLRRGADVVFTGADTGAVADVAKDKGKWAVTYDHQASCHNDACLTAPYWIWGPEYVRIAKQVKAKTYKAGYEYFDADSKAMALMGFMDGPDPVEGRRRAAGRGHPEGQGHTGRHARRQLRRFDVLRRSADRQHRARCSSRTARSSSSRTSTSSPPGAPGNECKTCMYWWNEGITSDLPDLSQ
jgi:basic membrane protein A